MTSREGINPLRPYYIPQSGLSPASNATKEVPAPSPSSAQVFGSSARDLIPDIDYSDYLDSSPSVSDWCREAINNSLIRYAQVLIAQPLDVAKTILQVYVVSDNTEEDRRSTPVPGSTYDSESDSSDDESSYFTAAAPATPSPSTPRSRKARHRITDRSGYIRADGTSSTSKHALTIKNPTSLMDVLSQLWTTNGPSSPWKSSNATFIYSLLLPSLNTFIRSLLSAIIGFPEEDIASSMTADILTAPSPLATLVLSFVSSSLSALILSPIDTARTLLMLTPATHGPRSLIRAIRQLPTPNSTIPPHLVPITVLHSSLPNFITTSTPLILKSYLSIDPLLNPSMWSLFTFLGSGLELAVKFPLETVLRRAQIATYTSISLRQKSSGGSTNAASIDAADVETIVPTPRTYRGIIGTMWHIVHEEGVSTSPSDAERARTVLGKPVSQKEVQKRQQGQGIQGLYRGWRMGMWGIAGMWGANVLGGLAGGYEEEVTMRGGHGRSSGGRF
ncbi:hypothetical protein N7504_002088 [Penicillium tannophilum]|nr:hypothetical protein N7504_002088 [Penicillium tannophilum]